MSMLSLRRGHFMYSYDKFEPQNLTFQMHHYYEILYFKSGTAKYIIDGNEYDARAGDVFITCPRELHSIVFVGSDTYERHFIQFDDELLRVLSPDLPARMRRAAARHKIAAGDVKKYGIDELFMAMQKRISEKKPGFDITVQADIVSMIAVICEQVPSSPDMSVHTPKKAQKIKNYISANFTRPLSLDEIAENVFFNKYYMCHLFKAETGMTIKEYIELLRFMYARKLHAEGIKMTDIAARCGYGDYSLFYKNFIKYSGGKSPKEFFR